MKRPKFEAMDAKLVEGDTVVVWKLDRLGRSMDELIEYVIGLGKRGVHVKSLTQDIDTTTAMGKALFYTFAVFGEIEHEYIVERTNAGLEAARKKGNQIEHVIRALTDGPSDACIRWAVKFLNVSDLTLERLVLH